MPPRASVDVVTAREPTPERRLHGILLTWDPTLLTDFITAANTIVPVEYPTLEPPQWLTEPKGSLTTQGFVQDTMAYLAESSGGYHDTILSPLTPMQSSHLSRRMGQIEMDRFIQACAKSCPKVRVLYRGRSFTRTPTLMECRQTSPVHHHLTDKSLCNLPTSAESITSKLPVQQV